MTLPAVPSFPFLTSISVRPPRWATIALLILALNPLRTTAGWNEFVATQYPQATDFDPQSIATDKPFVLGDGSVHVIRHSALTPLHFPHGLFIATNSTLVIEEVAGGLQIMTPFIVVEDGGALIAGGPESTNRYRAPLEIVLTGVGNESSPDQGIDDDQIYSVFDLVNEEYVRSAREPGEPDPNQSESSLFGNKVLAAGPKGRIDLFGAKGSVATWARLAATIDVDAGQNLNQIFLDENLSGDWAVGDRVVVSTSDFEPDHTEEAEITAVDLVTNGVGNQTRLTVNKIRHGVTGMLTGGANVFTNGPGTAFQWSHFGARDSATGADIRATVGLLTRNIVVRSYRTAEAPADALDREPDPIVDNLNPVSYTPTNGVPVPAGAGFSHQPLYPGKFGDPLSRTSNRRDIYGGHALFRAGSVVRLAGVEFSQLGQPGNFGRIGRYPIHFHLMREAVGSYVSHCSIHDSFNRWVTIHGTFGLGLTNNVGYKSFGHGFYIEDGVEQKNVFDGNCGILARPALVGEYDLTTDPHFQDNKGKPAPNPTFVPAPYWNPRNVYPLTFFDRENPSVFWISNKQNYFRNNIAAGAGMAGRGFWLVGLDAEKRNGPAWGMVTGNPGLVSRFPYISGIFAPTLEFYNNTAYSCWNGIGTVYDGNGVFSYPTNITIITNGVPKDFPGSLPNWDSTPRFAYDGDRIEATGYTASNPNPKALDKPGQPPNTQSLSVIDMMAHTTAFRNRQFGAWLRPYWWWVANSQFLDNIFGATLVSGGNEESAPAGFWGLVNNSDFVGFSDNVYRNQSRSTNQQLGINPTQTDRNPTFTYDTPYASYHATTPPYNYPELPPQLGRNEYGGGARGDTAHERRGYQFYDGPGPVLVGNSFHRFYPTASAQFPGNSPLPKPDYSWGETNWWAWFQSFSAYTNRFARKDPFLNAALGWFGPGNQWKYSALTWTTNLFFEPSVVVRHLVHETYNYGGALGDGDRQTFIIDTDGSLQGYVGAGSVNSWPAHKGIDFVPECRSAISCLATPYYFGNTDILLPPNVGNPAILFGKVQTGFRVPNPGDRPEDDLRYYINGFEFISGGHPIRLYGTLNSAGVRYTIQFRQGSAPGSREIPRPPPADFAIRFAALENTPGRNTMSYAICYPTNASADQFRITAAGVQVYQNYDNVPLQSFSAAWNTATNSQASLVTVTSTDTTNAVELPSGTVTAQWNATKGQLILTVRQTAPRSRKAFPLGLCDPTSNQEKFIGREAMAQWTAMVPYMEEKIAEDRYPREPMTVETVFEMVAKSLNDSPDSGSICVGIHYGGELTSNLPDINSITPIKLDDVFYDEAAKALKLTEAPTYPPCTLGPGAPSSYGNFQAAFFSGVSSAGDYQSGPNDDPDEDGLSNLQEYWEGLDPLAKQLRASAFAPGILTLDGVRYLTVTYRRPIGAEDLLFSVARSVDLLNWEEDEAAHETSVIPHPDGFETVTVRTSRNLDAYPIRFARIRATLR